MSEKAIKLEAQTRSSDESAKEILRNDFVPAVLYGSHLKENKILKIEKNILEKVSEAAGESSLIDLTIDKEEKPRKVLIKDFTKHPVKGFISHMDLYEVDMKKELQATIALNFTGEPRAVKELGGFLLKNFSEIEVKALPGALVNHIDVDISQLANFGDTIKMSDLKIPEGIKPLSESDNVVATILEPREEVEEEVKEEDSAEAKEEGEKKEETSDEVSDKQAETGDKK